MTPLTFGSIRDLVKKMALDFVNHKTDLALLPHKKIGHILSMIDLLSEGMIFETVNERVEAIPISSFSFISLQTFF